jgi:hypothetical protein
LSRARQARHHGADGHGQHVGDFPVGQTFDRVQDENLPRLDRQLVERLRQ